MSGIDGSHYMMFVYDCININNPEYHVRRRFDCKPSKIPVKKLGKLLHKNKKNKKNLSTGEFLKIFLSRQKSIATSNADLEEGAIVTVLSLYKR